MSLDEWPFSWLKKLFGLPLWLAGVALLIWNEYHHVHMVKLYAEASHKLTYLTDTTTVNPDNEGVLLFFDAWTHVGKEAIDPLYGVGGHLMAVMRNVQYYQWVEYRHDEHYTDSDGEKHTRTTYSYGHEWKDEPVSSNTFKGPAARHYQNFTLVTIPKLKVYSAGAQMAGYELHQQLIDSIPPAPSGTVPIDSTSETFVNALLSTSHGGAVPHHLRGDVVFYGQRPDHPVVGDVRVIFHFYPACHAWVLAQPHGNQLRPFTSSDNYWLTFCRFSQQSIDPRQEIDFEIWGNKWLVWSLRVIGWLMVVWGINNLFDWFVRIFENIPMLSPVIDMGVKAVAWVVGTFLSLIVIGVTFVVLRPWLGFTILAATAAVLVGLHVVYRQSRPTPPPLPTTTRSTSATPPPLPPK